MSRLRASLVGLLSALLLQPVFCAEPMTLKDYFALSGPAPSAHLAYGPAPSQYVEVFLPDRAGPHPLIVLLHGGCWLKKFGGMSEMRDLAAAFNQLGFAVWSIEYRRLDEDGGGYPGTYEDVARAVDLIPAHANRYALDLQRVVVVGHSAGAYLARWLAGRARIPEGSPLHQPVLFALHNVIALGSVGGDLRHDSAQLAQTCGTALAALVGAPSAGRADVLADTSPAELTPNGSHLVMINGTRDHLSVESDVEADAEVVRQRGDDVRVATFAGGSHFDEVSAEGPGWPLLRNEVLRLAAAAP